MLFWVPRFNLRKIGWRQVEIVIFYTLKFGLENLFCGVFFLQVKRVKKVTKIQHLLFHRIWKFFFSFNDLFKVVLQSLQQLEKSSITKAKHIYKLISFGSKAIYCIHRISITFVHSIRVSVTKSLISPDWYLREELLKVGSSVRFNTTTWFSD